MVALLMVPLFAGCLGDDEAPVTPTESSTPFMGYTPPEPDPDLGLLQEDFWLPAAGGTEIHVRVVRPEGPGPFPVIAQFTPYTAPGKNIMLDDFAEPMVGCSYVGTPGLPVAGSVFVGAVGCNSAFDWHFVRRGYAFAYGDVRGTGDSSGCLDLRGNMDIADLDHFTEWLGTQSWSNGNVGFIGASYPGSEAHMAALAGNTHLKAVIPVVASTSFYHYHHNDGVPYAGQHSLGGTNTGYTRNALAHTLNPQSPNAATRLVDEAQCPHAANVLEHGGLDQTGTYNDWWAERNLRERATTVQVPVLMAQGLADWNVKPDHIATWFNDLTVPKTLIAGQWHHAWPFSPCAPDANKAYCDDNVPYGEWWQYANAFFDTFLKGIDTGMFEGSVAWVQDSLGTWHRSADWPIRDADRETLVLHLQPDGVLDAAPPTMPAEAAWYGCADDQFNRGHWLLAMAEEEAAACDAGGRSEQVVFESAPLERDVIVSGVPLLDLTLKSETDFTHLVAVLEIVDERGNVVDREVRPKYQLGERENYGYLNPTFRNGLADPTAVAPGTPYTVTLDLYPQEDVIQAGQRVRLTLSSDDAAHGYARTIESYQSGTNTVLLGPGQVNSLTLPLRPVDLQGTRLD